MITVVTKPFDGPDGEITAGTIVDSSRWRNEGRLVNCRFLRPATEDEAKAVTPAQAPKERKAPTAAAAKHQARKAARSNKGRKGSR